MLIYSEMNFSMLRKTIKKFLRKFYFIDFLKKISKLINKKHPLQQIISDKNYDIKFCGTEYGGWSFVDEENLKSSTIISAGLGEDASFDIEFAAKYNAKIIIIDPTPRAITHYKEIIKNIGNISTTEYANGGKQPVNAYDLSKIKKDNLLLIEKALWHKNEKIRFYSPPNPEYVSHSILNFQNNYNKNSPFIEVMCVTIDSLLSQLNLNKGDIPLMKLDIEGAEIEFLIDCLDKDFKPTQILVEFDELNAPSKKGFDRVSLADTALKNNNYKLLKSDGKSNFLYYRN